MKRERDRIVFLGTGGGSDIMFTQSRKTGGIYLNMDGVRLLIDPGPGSLVYAQKLRLRPEIWDGLLISHLHIDHSSDANALLDGMKRPILFAEPHCLFPTKKYNPRVSKLHQKSSRVRMAVAGKQVKIKQLVVKATKAWHYDPTIGFRIEGTKTIGYASDGDYYKGQGKNYEGCDILILNVLVPKGMKYTKGKIHMDVDSAIKLINEIKNKPKLVIVQHFSSWIIHHGIKKQIGFIKKATGVKTIAAKDFMEISLDKI